METEGALFFYNKKSLVVEKYPENPVGVLFVTSIRDIVLAEFNGQYVKIDGNEFYMEGVIEQTLKQTQKGGFLEGLVDVKGVIVDDMESDLNGKFPLLPSDDENWIFPNELLSRENVWNIPSSFRKLPKKDISGRKKLKQHFENAVFAKAKEIGAEIIILDGYMARVEYLQSSLGMYGKVLNIHPAPTLLDKPFCFRGKDEVMDAIRFARNNGGTALTGATLHFVDLGLDSGKPVAYICETLVSADDTEISLMYKNYIQAKLPIFSTGLKHYILKIFPYL